METLEVLKLSEETTKAAKSYLTERRLASEAEIELLGYVLEKLPALKQGRSVMGREMAELLVCAENPKAKEALASMKRHTANYKGLERLLRAQEVQISLNQSVWKADR